MRVKLIGIVILITAVLLSASVPPRKAESQTSDRVQSFSNISDEIAQQHDSAAVAAAVGDSFTIIFSAYPSDACQDCTWALTIDESKMNTWLCNRVRDKLAEGKIFISLEINGNQCTVSALEYFKYGVKYTTYWTLTATSTENNELTASCSIQLG